MHFRAGGAVQGEGDVAGRAYVHEPQVVVLPLLVVVDANLDVDELVDILSARGHEVEAAAAGHLAFPGPHIDNPVIAPGTHDIVDAHLMIVLVAARVVGNLGNERLGSGPLHGIAVGLVDAGLQLFLPFRLPVVGRNAYRRYDGASAERGYAVAVFLRLVVLEAKGDDVLGRHHPQLEHVVGIGIGVSFPRPYLDVHFIHVCAGGDVEPVLLNDIGLGVEEIRFAGVHAHNAVVQVRQHAVIDTGLHLEFPGEGLHLLCVEFYGEVVERRRIGGNRPEQYD